MNAAVADEEAATTPLRSARPAHGVRRDVLLRRSAILVLALGCPLAFALAWDSPVRVALALTFVLFGPGLAIAELLDLRDVALRMTIACGSSIALATLVAVVLVYAGLFSPRLALGVLAGISVAAVLVAIARDRGSSDESK